jgi:hypothetical protein
MTRTHRRRVRTGVALLALLAIASDARADCEMPPPLCESYWSRDVVFDGTIVSVEPIEREGNAYEFSLQQGSRLVRKLLPFTAVTYRINQAWRGVTGQEVRIELGGRGYRVGQRYLIVGSKDASGVIRPSTGECGESLEYERATRQLEFLQTLSQPSTGGRVYGQVLLRHGGLAGTPAPRVSASADLTLTGNGVVRTVTTSDAFEFSGLRAGRYTLSIAAPRSYVATPPRVVTVENDRSCADTYFFVEPAGSIGGTVLDSEGRPKRDAQILLMRADDWAREQSEQRGAQTDANGHFDIANVDSGTYVVAVQLKNPAIGLSPSALMPFSGFPPREIEVDGDPVSLGTLRLPIVANARLKVRVLWDDGRPAAGVFALIEDITDRLASRHRAWSEDETDSQGELAFGFMPGRRFLLSVWSPPTLGRPGVPATPRRQLASPVEFSPAEGATEITVVVNPLKP